MLLESSDRSYTCLSPSIDASRRISGLASIVAILIASAAMAQNLGRPETVEEVPDAPSAATLGEEKRGYERRPNPDTANVLPRAQMPVWEYMYKKARDPSGDVRMFEEKSERSGASDSMWTRFKRSLGFETTDENGQALVKSSDGQWRALPSDRASDHLTNEEFLAAQELFRQEDYRAARSAFKKLAKRYKDKPLEEDVLFMQAECEFHLDWLPRAQDSYHRLLTKYPTTRYMPQAVQRTYDIAYFWLEDSRLRAEGKPGKYSVFTRYVNFFDNTRPLLDIEGRAIEAIEVIQQHDPFGPLTDDAVMMAGGQYFITDHYIQAAGYYEQLSVDQPQSEHTPRAVLLGAEAYRRSYRGPQYDSSDLEGAYRLTKAAMERQQQFDGAQGHRLEADLRAIQLERAKRDFQAGEDYRRRWLYTSAKFYYRQVIQIYPDTDWARKAEERLTALGDKETKKWSLTDSFVNPFSGRGRPQLSSDPFERSEESVEESLPAESTPAGPEDGAETPEAPEEKPSRFNLRNWFDKL